MEIYEQGRPWCQERYLHPQHQANGRLADTHLPNECRSYGGGFDGHAEDGQPIIVSAYLVRPLSQPRTVRENDLLAIEIALRDDDGEVTRALLPVSAIRSLAAHLANTAEVHEGWRRPRAVFGRDGELD